MWTPMRGWRKFRKEVFIKMGNTFIAKVYGQDVEANANLIAAAPDLLAAVRAITL